MTLASGRKLQLPELELVAGYRSTGRRLRVCLCADAGNPSAPFALFRESASAQNNQYTSGASLAVRRTDSRGEKALQRPLHHVRELHVQQGSSTPLPISIPITRRRIPPSRHWIVVFRSSTNGTRWSWPGSSTALGRTRSCRDSRIVPIFSYHSGLPFNLLVGGEVQR